MVFKYGPKVFINKPWNLTDLNIIFVSVLKCVHIKLLHLSKFDVWKTLCANPVT